MKSVAILAPHFPPSNLAAVHRTRLWAQHLSEFGWEPTVIATHWDYYEEDLDWDLCTLISKDLKVIRTKAISTSPIRLIGDIGIRSLYHHHSALTQLAKSRKIDFLHITIPSHYSALLGRLSLIRSKIPYGIDYIDPWVHAWPGTERVFSKAWVSMKLGTILEPWAVKRASLITGVADRYFADVLARNPHLRDTCHTAAMPYGNSELDFQMVRKQRREPYLFDPKDGNYHMIYAGALLPKAHNVLRRLFEAVAHLKATRPEIVNRLRLHFVGTGTSPTDTKGHNILPMAKALNLDDIVSETPNRIPYFDVLNHLSHSSAILVVGSTEAHYSPSKIYQSVDSRRPIFAMLHKESTAVAVLRKSKAGTAVEMSDTSLPSIEALAGELCNFMTNSGYDPSKVDWKAFESFSARESARQLARALDVALARATEA